MAFFPLLNSYKSAEHDFPPSARTSSYLKPSSHSSTELVHAKLALIHFSSHRPSNIQLSFPNLLDTATGAGTETLKLLKRSHPSLCRRRKKKGYYERMIYHLTWNLGSPFHYPVRICDPTFQPRLPRNSCILTNAGIGHSSYLFALPRSELAL